ncbi:transcriptional regulator [Mesorhizobium sp. Mes31]|uniref:transcriptional regulator n=1 Tax=Mesorhizobium sp. Mes31 TaxID=2926017 RepID=UPI0021173ECF|nr:transcriptional regulator [Mesorhizobium sp. Mes31]
MSLRDVASFLLCLRMTEVGGVSLSTVRDFEKGRHVPIGNIMNALLAALELRGIQFTENGITGPP